MKLWVKKSVICVLILMIGLLIDIILSLNIYFDILFDSSIIQWGCGRVKPVASLDKGMLALLLGSEMSFWLWFLAPPASSI